MVLHRFTTGLPRLDTYIGGLQPGDSVLLFASAPAASQKIISAISTNESSIPLVYLSADNSLTRFLSDAKKVYTFHPPIKRITSSSLLRSVGRFLSSKPRRSYILLDELSRWQVILGDERRIVEFFREIIRLVERRESVLVSSVTKSFFAIEHLAELKDSSSVCLDILQHREELYIFPLALKGRYKPDSLLPLRLSANDSMRSHPSGTVAAIDELIVGERAEELRKSFDPSENRYRMFFGAIDEPAVLFDLKGEHREFNEKALGLFNKNSDELRIAHPASFIGSGHYWRLLRALVDLRKKRNVMVELDVVKGSTLFPAEVHFKSLGEGLILAAAHDISDRRRIERQLSRQKEEYDRLIEDQPLPLLLIQNNEVLYANPAVLHLLREDKSSNRPPKTMKEILAPHSLKALQKVLREQPVLERSAFEATLLRRDGTTAVCLVAVSNTVFHGKRCVQLVLSDVSTMKESIDRLSEAESMYRNLLEQTPQAVAIVEGNVVRRCNRAYVELFGFASEDQLIGKPYASVEGENNVDWLAENKMKRGVVKHVAIVHNTRGQKGDGTFLELRVSAFPFPDRPERWMLFYEDITQQNILAEELEQRRSEMSLLREVQYQVQGSTDLQKLLHSSLHKTMEVLSWNVGGMYLLDSVGKELHLAHHRNFAADLLKRLALLPVEEGIGGFLAKTQEPHLVHIDRYPSYLPFRALFKNQQFEKLCLVPLLAKEKVIGVLLLASKASSRKPLFTRDLLAMIGNQLGMAISNAQSFEKLREIADRFQRLMSTSSVVLYTLAADGALEFMSDSVESFLGYSPKEFRRNKSLWLSIMHPDDKRILLERTANLDEIGQSHTSEYRMLPRGKAVHRWMRDAVTIERDSNGVAVRLYGTLSDVTEYREQLDDIAKRGSFTGSILASLDVGVASFDAHMACTFWNAAAEQVIGKRAQDVLGKSAEEILPRFVEEDIKEVFGGVLSGERVPPVTVRHQFAKQRNQRELCLRFAPLRDAHGSISGAVGTIEDITAQATRSLKLQESEQLLRNVIDTMGDIFIITDLKGTILQTNKAFERVLGYSLTEAFSNEFPYPWLLDEEMGRYVLWISSLREKNWLHDFDMTWKTKDGRLIPISLSTTLLRNSMGEPIAMLNNGRDITERKRLMKDLESRHMQIEMLNRIIGKANATMDFNEVFSTVIDEINGVLPVEMVNVGLVNEERESLEAYAVSGQTFVKRGDLVPIGQTVSQFVLRDQKPVIVDDFLEETNRDSFISTAKGMRSQISLPISLKGHIVGTLNIASTSPAIFTQTHVEMFQPIAQHLGTIIDRLRLFRQVTDDSTYIHNLLDSIDNIVYTVDRSYRIREVNEAWYEFIRQCDLIPLEEYAGKNLFDVLPSENLKVTFQNVVDQLLNGSVRIFSEEYVHHFEDEDRTYQLTVTPMVVEEVITGLVFTHTDISTLKHTEAMLKQQNEQLLALNEISSLISTARDLNDMLESAIPLFMRTTRSDAIIVYLTDAESGDFVAIKQIGFDGAEYASIMRLKGSGSATGGAVEAKQSVFIRGRAYDDERIVPANRELLRREHLEALAVIPLISQDNVIGALDLFYKAPHAFTSQDRQVLTLVGNQLGSVIENTRLYSELRSQIARLTTLYQLSQQLTSTLEVEQVLRVVAESTQRIVPFRELRIGMVEGGMSSRRMFEYRAEEDGSDTLHMTKPEQEPVPFADEQEWQAISNRQPYRGLETPVMSVPMLSKETILGIMTVRRGSDKPPYTIAMQHALESIANLSAIALEKATLYEETVRISHEIQRRNKELDDFTYVVSHDLKEPLISIEGFSRILQADYEDSIQQEGKDYLESIVGATTRMKGLIDDLLMLSRVSRPSEAFKPISIKAVIRDIETDMVFTIRQKGVKMIVPDDLPFVLGNETQLKVVFRNLIGNAIKFNNKPNPVVEIEFRNAENNSYLFIVRDNGIGIEKDFFEKIFVIFQRLHRREEYEGSGAGLAIVKKILEIHKGTIWVESEVGKGSTFYFTVPKASE